MQYEHELPGKVLNLLKSKFNIIEHISFLEFDYDFDILKTKLSQVYKEHFDQSDKIIIEHLDTDFYYAESTVGVNLRNFFTVVDMVGISPSVFIFYTNHFGISREIDIICKDKHNRPLVLESFLSKVHYPESEYLPIDINVNNITCHALSLINGKRSYRNALFNHTSHISKDCLAIAYSPPK